MVRRKRRRPSRPAHETGIIRIDGKTYKLVDAGPGKGFAKRVARDLRTPLGGLYPPESNRTLSRWKDMGPGAGRLRYGVFVRRGRPYRRSTILRQVARIEKRGRRKEGKRYRGPTVAWWERKLRGHR